MYRARLNFIFIFLILSVNPLLVQAQDKIPFYLPVSSEDYPNIKHHLDAALFSAGLGQFSTETTDYWHKYQQGIKLGRPGIYLAAPHFVAWAQHKHDFIPLIKLESEIQYVLAARSGDIGLFEVDDLNKRSVCTQSHLNLDSILLNHSFSNPLYSAQNIVVSDVLKELRLNNKTCDAFSLANHLFLAHNLTQPKSLIRLQQGPLWPPYAWIIHPQLEAQRSAMIQFLRSDVVIEILSPITRTFSDGNRLLDTDKKDYPKSLASPLFNYWGKFER